MPGTLFVVATPIGNLEDVTARALRILREVAIIGAEDTRRTAHLLARYAITTPTTSLHAHNERRKTSDLLGRLQRGEDVAVVSDAGTPTISDPGRLLIQAAADAGISVVSVPGPNAAIAALAASGFSADSFRFMGFPPTRSKDRSGWLDSLCSDGGTVVFYEAPHRIRETLIQLQVRVGDKPALLCRELTKVHEQLVRGPISTILGSPWPEKGEFTVVVELGHMIDIVPPGAPDHTRLLHEFGEMTEKAGLTRRMALASLAKRYNLAPNEIYGIVELAKKQGHTT